MSTANWTTDEIEMLESIVPEWRTMTPQQIVDAAHAWKGEQIDGLLDTYNHFKEAANGPQD